MLVRIIQLLLLVLYLNAASAEVFTVSSNADAGAGTLREALTKAAANGIAEKDYIRFNLLGAGEEGRTIILQESLPDLSSNLVIDGSTQPGNKIGLSDARVILKTLRSKTSMSLFNGNNISQVEFYGFYFFDTTNSCLSDPDAASKTSIKIHNGKNIVIGDQDKGNVFTGYKNYIIDFDHIDGLQFGSNIFGQSPYELESICSGMLELSEVTNVIIGGENKSNTFISAIFISLEQTQTVNNIQVINNNFGLYSDGITTNWALSGTVFLINGEVRTTSDPKPKVSLVFRDNLFTHYDIAGIELNFLEGNIDIKHNWFGIDRTGTIPLNLQRAQAGDGNAIMLQYLNATVLIGDEDPDETNRIAYSSTGILNNNSEKVRVLRNSFKCIGNSEYVIGGSFPVPVVEITDRTDNYVKGTSTPGATVDVFTGDDCVNCSPQTYIGTTRASSAGEWQFDLTKTYALGIIANAHAGNQSSNFAKPVIRTGEMIVTDADCSSGGSISGITVSNTKKIKWLNENGDIVSTEPELKNVPPGKYKLVIGEYCTVESDYYTIRDLTPKVLSDNIHIGQPECGGSDGNITHIQAYTENGSPLQYVWLDQDLKQVGQSAEVRDLPAGSYTLTVSSAHCTVSYGPVILQSAAGPAVDASGVFVQATACNQQKGSVSGLSISGTGALQYSWRDEQDREVGVTKDLFNQPAGKYSLRVSDGTPCGIAYSQVFEITEINGITMDVLDMIQSPATCNHNNGSITGIKVTGAVSYQWLDEANKVVAATPDLNNAAPGKYRLLASNAACSKSSAEFTVNRLLPELDYPSAAELVNAGCGQNNGSIRIVFSSLLPRAYRWEDSNGATISTSVSLENMDAGVYRLYITDEQGCEGLYRQYTINRVPLLQIIPGSGNLIDDQCSQSMGSIGGISITGGELPYAYKWFNREGQLIGTDADLLQVPSGTYRLQVTDAGACVSSQTYVLNNQPVVIPAPVAADVKLCSPGPAILTVSNPVAGYRYRVYDGPGSTEPLDEQADGRLKVSVKSGRSFYISQLAGSCESARTRVTVNTGVSGAGIANTFTPNGDHVNDTWQIKGTENYPQARVQVFNRYGETVFESKASVKAFDGTANGRILPAGVYYYIIHLGSGCNLLSGSLTLIR